MDTTDNLVQLSTQKSTTVRSQTQQTPSWLKAGFNLLERSAPQAAAALLQRLFTTPPHPALRPEEKAVLAKARRWHSKIRGKMVAGYEWGEGPAVLLMHGWGGHAGHMSGLVQPLVDAGFRAVAIDAPGHGASARGLSNMLWFHAAIEEMARHAGPVHGIVSHSLGAAATTYALSRHLKLPRAVFIGPFSHFDSLWASLRLRTGFSQSVVRGMMGRMEAQLGVGFEELDPLELAKRMDAPLLVIHDQNDEQVFLTQGQMLVNHWPGARLHITQGLGHLKILKDPASVAAAVEFLKAV